MTPGGENMEQQLLKLMRKRDSRLSSLEAKMENLSTSGREGVQSGSTKADGSWRYQDRVRRGVNIFKNLKLEFPLFNGGMDPEDWSYIVEQLLSYHQVATEEWVIVASINLQG